MRVIPILLSVFWILSSFFLSVHAQETDTSSPDIPLDTPVQLPPDTLSITDSITSYQKQLELFSLQTDSLKERAIEGKTTYNHLLQEAKSISQKIMTVQKSIDSSQSELQQYVRDSLSLASIHIKQLTLLKNRFDHTLEDVFSFRQNILDSLQKQQENSVSDIQDSLVDSIAILPPIAKTNSNFQKSYQNDPSTQTFFKVTTWNKRIFLIILSLIYFYWLFELRKKSSKTLSGTGPKTNSSLIKQILKTLSFFLLFLPLFSPVIPVIILFFNYLIVYLALFLINYPVLSTKGKKITSLFLLFYLSLLLLNAIDLDTLYFQIAIILLNAVSIVLILKMKGYYSENHYFKGSSYIFFSIVCIHLISLLTLFLGRLSLSLIWLNAAGIGLTHILSLHVFRNTLHQDLKTQTSTVAESHLLRKVNFGKILINADRIILWISFVLFFIVLFNTLQVIEPVLNFLKKIFSKERQLGSITFNYANLLWAIFVFWLANTFQKSIKSFLDNSNGDPSLQKKHALFPVLRLAIILFGFFLAISILGVGLDKLTIILGALSVGIGLGLQNIINNFVSGVILFFEKPFKTGDYLELGDKKGQVIEIGIRSSTLITDRGAKVIIPNGDLLSGQLVNRTFAKTDIRVNFEFVFGADVPIDDMKMHIKNLLLKQKHLDKSFPIKILLKSFSPADYQLSIQASITHVKYMDSFRSNFIQNFRKEMKKREINFSSLGT